MHVLKKIAVITALGAALILFSGLFHFTELSNRMIVFGIGIDYENNQHRLSVEVAMPLGASGESQTGSGKIFEGEGSTIALALLDLYKKSGKVPSIGQCNIIIFGEEYYTTQNVAEAASFFSYADEISDGVLVATCEGKASDYLKNAPTLDPYISTALQKTIETSADKVGTAKVKLKDFVNRQYDITKDAYLTHVSFIKAGEEDPTKKDEKSKLPSGYFSADKITLFKSGLFNTILDGNLTTSLMFMTQGRAYQPFEVTEDTSFEGQIFPQKIGVGITTKNVKIDYRLTDVPIVAVEYSVRLKRLRNNVEDELMHFVPKKHEDISEKARQDIERQIKENTESLFKKSKELDNDFIGLAKSFYAEHGAIFEKYIALHPDWLDHVELSVTCKSF